MASFKKSVHLKRVTDPRLASKAEIVTAVLAILGGATRAVSVDELALACHRLEPKGFAWPEYSWLPNLDNVRVTLVDIARAGAAETLTNGRSHQKLWRLTEAGQEWAKNSAPLLNELRRRLPDESSGLEPSILVAVAVHRAIDGRLDYSAPRERVVAEAFRMFPTVFGLRGFRGWPDTAKIDEAIQANRGLIWSGGNVGVDRDYGPKLEQLVRELAVGSQGFGAARRRITQGGAQKAVARVEKSRLYKAFSEAGELTRIDPGQLCDLLSITLEAEPDILRTRLNTLAGFLDQAERWDLADFVKWLKSQLAARKWKLLTDEVTNAE